MSFMSSRQTALDEATKSGGEGSLETLVEGTSAAVNVTSKPRPADDSSSGAYFNTLLLYPFGTVFPSSLLAGCLQLAEQTYNCLACFLP
jgi:hypothetical protein